MQAGRRAVTAPTRMKWLLLLEAKVVAAEQAAAAKKPRAIWTHRGSIATLAINGPSGHTEVQPFPRFVGGSPRLFCVC